MWSWWDAVSSPRSGIFITEDSPPVVTLIDQVIEDLGWRVGETGDRPCPGHCPPGLNGRGANLHRSRWRNVMEGGGDANRAPCAVCLQHGLGSEFRAPEAFGQDRYDLANRSALMI